MATRRELIERYYEACNSGEVERVVACFEPGASHFFTRLPAARGAAAIGAGFAWMAGDLHARWTVEFCIEQGDDACIEWSMTWTEPKSGEARIDRGSEWYRFDGDLIAEIRAYHHSDAKNRSGDLIGFDHAGRGDTMLA